MANINWKPAVKVAALQSATDRIVEMRHKILLHAALAACTADSVADEPSTSQKIIIDDLDGTATTPSTRQRKLTKAEKKQRKKARQAHHKEQA